MSIHELEAALDGLSVAEQQRLLRHLEENLHRTNGHAGSPSRQDWMRRLDALRTSIASTGPTLSSEELLADLRDE